YQHEMPGGQYSNLQQQAKAVGLFERWDEVKEMYHEVNMMFGDIVKVTPSSKVVGDMALFMVQNNLSQQDIYAKGADISFPDSVISLFQGDLGQPVGGFPEKLQKVILKDRPAYTDRPGKRAKEVDFIQVKQELTGKIGRQPTQAEVLSYLMYPDVFVDYCKTYEKYGDIKVLDTPTFFNGMRQGEKINVSLEKGKNLILRLDEIGEADIEGNRTLYFKLNGQRRELVIKDNSIKSVVRVLKRAETSNKEHIGPTMSGSVLEIRVKTRERNKKGQMYLLTETMKIQTSIVACLTTVINY